MAGKCGFKENQWEASSQMQKKREKNLNRAEYSSSVANAPTLSPLIEPKDVLPSSWIPTHEKKLLTAHLAKWDKNNSVYV